MPRREEAEGHFRTEPDKTSAELHPSGRSLLNAPFEELTDQNTTAQAGSTHGLTQNTGETASVGRRMHLKLPFGGHQMQGWRIRDRCCWPEARPLQSLLILIQGVLERLGIGEACGHHGSICPGAPGETLNVAARSHSTRGLTPPMVFGQGENQPPARLDDLHTTDEPIP